MATQEKLQKSLEALKKLSESSQTFDAAKKKEKIHHCHVVTEAISNNNTIRISTNFQLLLGITIETLLKLCNDPESDIRMTTEECLNRVIRAVTDDNIGKVQFELHKEIKKNGPVKSLRAALWRFSLLAHHIRPHKGKAYVQNLFPVIVKIAQRSEEPIHETLANSLPKIVKILGNFSPDSEVKLLLKAFLSNVSHQSAVVRRTSATCILSICLNSRKPYVFLSYAFNYLIELLVPVNENQLSPLILGVLSNLKLLISHLENYSDDKISVLSSTRDVDFQPLDTGKFLQIYELCLYYLTNKDHNVINASLETLNTVILYCPTDLRNILLNKNGIDKCRIFKNQIFSNVRSPSQLSVATNTTSADENLFSEIELTETTHSDIEKWIGESKLSVMNMNFAKTSQKSQSTDTLTSHTDSALEMSEYENFNKANDSFQITELKSLSVDNLDKVPSSNSSEKSFSCSTDDKLLYSESDFQEIDIGDYLDKNVPLLYCIRLISKSFLLLGTPGKCISDKTVRVSVKSLALTCISSILKIYPQGFIKYLDRNASGSGKIDNSNQLIADLLLYSDHADPQLRGLTRSLVANFINSVITSSKGDFGSWIKENCKDFQENKLFGIENCVNILIQGLKDESATCLRQTIISLDPTLNIIGESQNCKSIMPVLEVLPQLACNPYWLVKVALSQLVSKLSYTMIHYISQNDYFQSKVLYNVLFELLKDEDQRIRTASANAFIEIIPNLFYEEYESKQTIATSKAVSFRDEYLSNLNNTQFENSNKNIIKKHFINNMPFPFYEITKSNCDKIDYALSKIISTLCIHVRTSASKHFISGCIETLSLLSNHFPCTVYRKSWVDIKTNMHETVSEPSVGPIPDLLSLCMSLFTGSSHVYDLQFHINLTNLTSNLYAGYSIFVLRPVPDLENTKKTWEMFATTSFSDTSDQYLNHVVRLMNIFHYVLNGNVPAQPHSKAVLQRLPSASSFSPIKRRKSDVDGKKMFHPGKIIEKDDKSEKKETFKMGNIVYSQHYVKIFGVLRSSYMNYKISLDSEVSEKFLDFLAKTIHSLSVIMEVASLNEFGKIAEEVLEYLRSTFRLDPTGTVSCVQQLLKCLFGTNLTSNITEFSDECSTKYQNKDFEEDTSSFYYNIFQIPYNEVSACINSLTNISKIECDGDSTLMGYLHRKDVKVPTTLSRNSDKILANYIRIFEPMVIKSLKQYTITSNVELQCRVLQLLSQLIQLRVNYCMLDSEQVFIGFVLKQFEYIEEGQIALAKQLILRIFQFLVQLSYNKQHSKCIMSVPKIMQLCDGLMASGQCPITHCIPALEPIVEDIFLTRNKANTTDIKELETTREVMLSMLLRLLEHKEVINLITLVLKDSQYCADNSEKWYRWSQQVVNVLFPMLKQNKIRLDDAEAFAALKGLIFALNPNVFESMDDVIVMIFQDPPDTEDTVLFNRWLSKVILLFMLVTLLKEDVLLSKIHELKSQFNPGSIFESYTVTADPLNVYNNADAFENISSGEILIRFLFRVTNLISKSCLNLNKLETKENNDFILGQSYLFLIFCLYIFQSGSHCKIAKEAMKLIKNRVNDELKIKNLNKIFLELARTYPLLTFQWCYVLTVLNYSSLDFWTRILPDDPSENSDINFNCNSCINEDISTTGGTIVFCDYLNENISQTDELYWFLSKNTVKLVSLVNEAPVTEFISFVHRNATLSKVFIDHIATKCFQFDDSIFKTRILKCIGKCHASQNGVVLNLLIPKMINYRLISISRLAANLASSKIEYLLTLPMEEVISQMPKENLIRIREDLISYNLVTKHEALVSLLNKLFTQYYDLSPIELDQRRTVDPEYIKKLHVNKKWFLEQIKGKYKEAKLGKELAEIMNRLEYNEIVSYMSSSDFNRSHIQNCIRLGVKMMEKYKLKEEPAILKASVECLLKDISNVISKIYMPHQVFEFGNQQVTSPEMKYSNQMADLFKSFDFSNLLVSLAPSISSYLSVLPRMSTTKLSDANNADLIKFAVVSLEYTDYIIHSDGQRNFNINSVNVLVSVANDVFKEQTLVNILESDSYITWLCSAINCLFRLATFLLKNEEPLPSIPNIFLNKNKVVDTAEPATCAFQSCSNLYVLVSWLYKIRNQSVNIPNFLLRSIKSCIVSLGRLRFCYSYNLTPSKVWKTGWELELSGTFKTQVPPLPIDMLQEVDVLEEYIYRITLLGWTSRQQFEETWMCFLSVLCTPLSNLDPAELPDAIHASSIAIKAITTLLLQTMYYPVLGCSNVSKILHVSRNTPIIDDNLSIKKLKMVHSKLQHKYEEKSQITQNTQISNVFDQDNLEKITDQYTFGQVSVRYLLIATNIIDDENDNSSAAKIHKRRSRMLQESGLDIHSCLQFLLDYYTQLMKPESSTNIKILYEVIKSTVTISDLFTDRSQFSWMMDLFLQLTKMHPVEDELIHQYLVIGICKAAAVLNPDLDIFEKVKRLLVQYLKSPFITSRTACLHGMLYVLEGCKLHNITIGGVSDEMQLILPCAVEYVQLHITPSNSVVQKSQEHTMLVWSLAFYLIENVDEVHMESNFATNTLQAAFNLLQTGNSNCINNAVIKGIERLTIVKKQNIMAKFGKQILKLALFKMKNDNHAVSILGTQLLLSYMYNDCSEHLESPKKTSDVQTSPDHLVQTIEKISAVFDRIKKGSVLEAEVLCSILPSILKDFFSPSDILTKVINEFLSPQQPHPKLLSRVVFKVFECAIEEKQLMLLQDWVVFSLSNFTQSCSIGMATWCLTCFFISASSNQWLRSYFPYVQTRVGKYEYEDKNMLCIAGADFYRNLTNDTQKETFVDSFKKVKDQPGTPFNDLLSSL